jgi:hypothetical protein
MISAAPGVVRACAGPTWMFLLARLAVARLAVPASQPARLAGFEPAAGCLEGTSDLALYRPVNRRVAGERDRDRQSLSERSWCLCPRRLAISLGL